VPPSPKPPTLLIISQVYLPDPASVGQHMADAATAMVGRGYRVVVLTANRGFEDPSVIYPLHEWIDGVEVRRLPWSSFGKSSIGHRLIAGLLFVFQAILVGVMAKNLSRVLVSTSPPMGAISALVIGLIRRVPFIYWVMDLNPDQIVALGKAKPTSLPVRLFNALNRVILDHAAHVVVLDRFMAKRVLAKRPIAAKMTTLPPWPHNDNQDLVPHQDNPFRHKHNLEGKFVVMFSGNLSIASPVTTLLQAAIQLQNHKELVFVFIGGGLGKQEVEQAIETHHPTNIISLPYQPLKDLKYSLSAADVHLVAMGDSIVGICHPCKVYGAMAVARPILLLGPRPCHVSDLIDESGIGWQIPHHDVDGATQALLGILHTDPEKLQAMGVAANALIADRLSKKILCKSFCDILESKRTFHIRSSQAHRHETHSITLIGE